MAGGPLSSAAFGLYSLVSDHGRALAITDSERKRVDYNLVCMRMRDRTTLLTLVQIGRRL